MAKKESDESIGAALSKAVSKNSRGLDGSVTSAAITLGHLVKQGIITREENDARLSELLAWDSGKGPKPEWVG